PLVGTSLGLRQSPCSRHTTLPPLSVRALVKAPPAAPEPMTSTSARSSDLVTSPPYRRVSLHARAPAAAPIRPALPTALGKRSSPALGDGCNSLRTHRPRSPRTQ